MSQSVKPNGHFAAPLLVFGFVSLLLGTVVEVMGVFDGATESLRGLWMSGGLEIRVEMGLPGTVGVLVTAAASFGLIAAILGSPGMGRRFVLGFSGVFLSLTLIPAFAVWGIFWKPLGVLLAVGWSWFSAMIYAQTHRMPCEGEVKGEEAANVISLTGDHGKEESTNRVNGKR